MINLDKPTQVFYYATKKAAVVQVVNGRGKEVFREVYDLPGRTALKKRLELALAAARKVADKFGLEAWRCHWDDDEFETAEIAESI